eukprot:GHVR01007291.1.p1 GENE.GHVR01007291.1~~GHVR01007291.1.p1  ORF type:complete len:331 (+),score=32.75 GHVR01007291.1:755-1747(+)
MSFRATSVLFSQVRPILVSAAESGVDVEGILTRLGLVEGMRATDPERRLELKDYYRIQRDIAQSLDDLTARLSERTLTYKTGNFVIAQAQQSRTLQDAMVSLAEHFNMMHGAPYNSVRVGAGHSAFVVDDSTFPYRFRHDTELMHFVGDCLLIKVHCLLDSLSNGLATQAIRRVRLQRTRSGAPHTQNEFWDVPLEFGRPAYELVYDYDIACQTIPNIDRIDLSTDGIFARILELVAEDCVDQGEVAVRLGVSVATLRRRLDEEGLCFRDLVRQARFNKAEHLLINGRSVSQVCETLNYSDIRAFNRAFKKWKGQTPAEFAKQAKPLKAG